MALYIKTPIEPNKKRWTAKRYKKKVRKLGYAISQIGAQTAKKLPTIIGLAEVENKLVIDDLLNSKGSVQL